jgi:hypothetical protein
MDPLIPNFLSPFMAVGTMLPLAALLLGLNRSLKMANWSAQDRVKTVSSTAALIAVFYLAALLPASAGVFHRSGAQISIIQLLAMPFAILSPIVIGVLLFLWWRPLRRLIATVPQQWIVGLQLYRTEGVVFLVLLSIGRLPREFALPAGVGDIFVGLTAPLVAIAVIRKWRSANTLLLTWNLLGLLDLVTAVATGFLTSPSPLQRLALDRPNQLVNQYPLVMIPVFLVPLAILLHLASLQKLRQATSTQKIADQSAIGQHA